MKAWVLMLGLVASPAFARAPVEKRIDPRADRELRKMSDYLGGLRSFRVDVQSTDERVTTDGQKLQFVADSRVTVRRPDRLRTDRLGPLTDTVVRYDGHSYSVFGNRTGYYAIAPAPPTLDAAIDVARERYGVDAPAADLFFSRPYQELIGNATTGRYIGREPVNGVPTHHLAFEGADADWQIWIADSSRPLPLRYVITTKDETTQPELSVALSHWQPDAPVEESQFELVPPPGAQRVRWMPLAPPAPSPGSNVGSKNKSQGDEP